MISAENYPIFGKNISSLKELSRDDSNPENIQYMTELDMVAINFDAVKTQYVNSLGLSEEFAASFDALTCASDGITFIEFKNGMMKNERKNVKNKIRDSLLIFCDITSKRISETRQMMNFILVYNLEKNPLPNQLTKNTLQESSSRNNIGKHFMQKSGQEYILFDLERFKKLYFKEVHTYSKEEFAQYFKGL